jgi:hypothetical protein
MGQRVIPEQGGSLEEQLARLLERDAIHDAEMKVLQAQLAELRAATAPRPPVEPQTLIPGEYRHWVELTAGQKTQLVATARFPPAPGTAAFDVQLCYLPRRSLGGGTETPPSEHPRARLHAHNEAEARALYLDLCGIRSHDPEVTELVCTRLGVS